MGVALSKKDLREGNLATKRKSLKSLLDSKRGSKTKPPVPPTTRKDSKPSSSKVFSEAEVQSLITREGRDVMVIHGNVYDVTSFTETHPGGAAAIKTNVGKEMGQTFESIHGPAVHKKLGEFFLGWLGSAPSLLTEAEVQRRIKEEKRALLCIQGSVYDVTEFVASHPGGEAAIMSRVGEEVGEMFERIHSKTTKEWVKQFLVGYLPSATAEIKNVVHKAETIETMVMETKVLKSVEVGLDIKNITLLCPERLELLPGGHVAVLVPDASGKGVMKASYYTPFICEETSFTITVKKFPHGLSSIYLYSLKPGDPVKYKGPSRPNWVVEEDEALMKEPEDKRHVLFIAGGVGVTPIYTMVRYVLQHQIASVTLLVSYQVPEVMLLRKDIASLIEKYGKGTAKRGSKEKAVSSHKTLDLHYFFTRTEETPHLPETPNVHLSRFGDDLMQKLSPTVSSVICGPSSFVDSVVKGLVKNNICTAQHVHIL